MDVCVFVRNKGESIVIIAIYVDYGLIASNDKSEIDSVISYTLKNILKLKNWMSNVFWDFKLNSMKIV